MSRRGPKKIFFRRITTMSRDDNGKVVWREVSNPNRGLCDSDEATRIWAAFLKAVSLEKKCAVKVSKLVELERVDYWSTELLMAIRDAYPYWDTRDSDDDPHPHEGVVTSVMLKFVRERIKARPAGEDPEPVYDAIAEMTQACVSLVKLLTPVRRHVFGDWTSPAPDLNRILEPLRAGHLP